MIIFVYFQGAVQYADAVCKLPVLCVNHDCVESPG